MNLPVGYTDSDFAGDSNFAGDANFAGDSDDRTLTYGDVFTLAGPGITSQRARKQPPGRRLRWKHVHGLGLVRRDTGEVDSVEASSKPRGKRWKEGPFTLPRFGGTLFDIWVGKTEWIFAELSW